MIKIGDFNITIRLIVNKMKDFFYFVREGIEDYKMKILVISNENYEIAYNFIEEGNFYEAARRLKIMNSFFFKNEDFQILYAIFLILMKKEKKIEEFKKKLNGNFTTKELKLLIDGDVEEKNKIRNLFIQNPTLTEIYKYLYKKTEE